MKAFVFVLLCALVAVQGRYTALEGTRDVDDDSLATLGQYPYVLSLRIAVSTSGLLNSGMGSLIDANWALTTASNLQDARFIWIRYGAVNELNPSLVTENTVFSIHPEYDADTGENNIGLISIARTIEFTVNIAPISPVGQCEVGAPGTTCVYVAHKLLCLHINVGRDDNAGFAISGHYYQVSSGDIGSPLVIDGLQAGIIVGPGSNDSIGLIVETAVFTTWMEDETGINLTPDSTEVNPDPVRVVQ